MSAPVGQRAPWRDTLYRVIFGHDSPAGKAFDVVLILLILASVAAVMLDSVKGLHDRHAALFQTVEWGFTLLFTVEYLLRLVAVPRPSAYARSFFGLIDLVSVLPTYLSTAFPGAQYLLVIRILRVLRVFRILKLVEYVGEADTLVEAIRQSRRKIAIFFATVATCCVILGAAMYLIEGPAAGFSSIPRSVYWTIVTITTVGYGDIAPSTPVGQLLAAIVMLLGYAIIAVPTGIVTVELGRARSSAATTLACPSCRATGHAADARHCRRCGARLAPDQAGKATPTTA
ncbi:MAG: ion transporter [Gemmatimonadales bacterium]